MRTRRLTSLLTLMLALASASPALAVPPPRDHTARQAAAAAPSGGVQTPADEHRLSDTNADADHEADADEAPPPENLETSLYLHERPDALGAAARAYQDAQLERLLHEREAMVVARRSEAIGLLEQFIREEPEQAAEMPDALLRLAELRWEVARSDYLTAFAAWQEVPEANRGAQPEADYSASMALYDRILERHRDYPRTDFVLYMKAYGLLEAGHADDALVLYRRILSDFPDSRFVPDAHFALAEAAFTVRGDFTAALAEYENVLHFEQSQLYDISLFKSAWCMWRMGRNTDAATRFRQVLDLASRRGPMSSEQRRRLNELQDEALDYLIQVFIEDESNTAADLFHFLQEIGGERYARRVLVRLSDTYLGQSRYDRAVEAYQLLLQMDASVPDAPEYQRNIASAYASMDDVPHTIAAMRTLAETYAPGSTWANQQGDPADVEREQQRNERMIRRQAMRYHEIGQRENQRRKYEEAAELYGVYLEHYGDRDAAYQIGFYLGEILFHHLERYPEAGDAYLAAARRKPDGEYTRDALYNAIGAFEHVREGELENCVRGPAPAATTPAATTPAAGDAAATAAATPSGPARCGESENDLKFGAAIELYVQLFPQDPDLPEILFRQGRLYYDRQIFDPAVRLFGQLLERFPESEYAAPAGELILDSFNRAEDYANIESWARRLQDAPAFASEEKQHRLDGLILQSIFKIGEQLAGRGQHTEAADAYFRAAEEFPHDDRARQAYFNAGVERQAAGDLPGAAQAYDRLIDNYPGSTEGAQGAWTAAQMYESIAQFSDAAGYYESYAAHFPHAEKVADALYDAVLLRVTAGDNDDAVRDGQHFLEQFPRHDSAGDVSFFTARAYENAEEWQDAARTYRSFIRRTHDVDREVEAQTRLAGVLHNAGDDVGAERALTAAVNLGRRQRSRLSDGLYYAAQARHAQGDAVLAQYEAVQIAGDQAGLADRLTRKSELLREAATIYADTVSFGVAEWVTASLFQIGQSYELFAEAMRAFQIPEGLSEEEEQVYMDQLARFIVPMEERALEAYEGGYQRALELHIYNTWTARLREGLTRLNDVQYPPLREAGGRIAEDSALPLPAPLEALSRGHAPTSGSEAAAP